MTTNTRQDLRRIFDDPDCPIPAVQLLSNGRYHVMITSAGGGYSRWNDLDVTRWREDSICDNWGSFCYLRDVASGQSWSNAHQPTLEPAKIYKAILSTGKAEFRLQDPDYDTHTTIVVSTRDDVEVRRVRIINRCGERRIIEVSSYAEIVLAPAATDSAHPAFSKLFVETEILRERRAILSTRSKY